MKALLLDPRVFNFIILALYGLNVCRWAWEGKWGAVAYWLCAAGITASVTFLETH